MRKTQSPGRDREKSELRGRVLGRTARIASIYLAAGLLWVFLFDVLPGILFPGGSRAQLFGVIRRPAFVIFTFLLFSGLSYREIGRTVRAKEEAEKLRRRLKDANALFAAIFDSSQDVVAFALDTRRRYLMFNENHRQAVRTYWNENIEVGGDPLAAIPGAEMREGMLKMVGDALSGHSCTQVVEFRLPSKPPTYWQSVFSPIRHDDGSIVGAVCFSINITERKRAEEEREYLLYHDELTGLYNRRYYENAFFSADQPGNFPISFIIGDVNGLKLVNDAFGHLAGDELLRAAARALAELCRPGDILARWGGDEFIALLPRTGEKEAQRFVEAARERASKLLVNSVHLDITFGWATRNAGQESLNGAIKAAEDTMYRQKLFEGQSARSIAIQTILRTLHEKNPREEEHSERVGKLSRKIALAMGYPEERAKTIYLAGYVHDIGKIAIEDQVLNKPGRLTDEEFAVIREHPGIGSRILRSSCEYAELAEAILAHHERWDGLGYPRGIRGEQIPIYARIISVADSFDAMTSARPYRRLVTAEEAAEEIRRCIGRQYDPFVAWIFLEKVLPSEKAVSAAKSGE